MDIAKPYTIVDATAQAEDIDRMFDELYQAVRALAVTSTGTATSSGATPAQVSARVLHEL